MLQKFTRVTKLYKFKSPFVVLTSFEEWKMFGRRKI